jgi:putative SOS response-associated peptidase YedK
MTSRFFRRAISWADYRAVIDLTPPPGVAPPEPEYNIAPGQFAPILRRAPEGEDVPRDAIQMAPAVWNFIPSWARPGPRERPFTSFTARAEDVFESRVFAGALRHGRCLVPMSGYYVWEGPKGAGRPFAISRADGAWFCLAGLWNRVLIEGSEIDTFAILTSKPNDLESIFRARLPVVHAYRMPLILAPQHLLRWLDPSAPHVHELFRPFPAEKLVAAPAHPSVGDVRRQGPHLLGDADDTGGEW